MQHPYAAQLQCSLPSMQATGGLSTYLRAQPVAPGRSHHRIKRPATSYTWACMQANHTAHMSRMPAACRCMAARHASAQVQLAWDQARLEALQRDLTHSRYASGDVEGELTSLTHHLLQAANPQGTAADPELLSAVLRCALPDAEGAYAPEFAGLMHAVALAGCTPDARWLACMGESVWSASCCTTGGQGEEVYTGLCLPSVQHAAAMLLLCMRSVASSTSPTGPSPRAPPPLFVLLLEAHLAQPGTPATDLQDTSLRSLPAPKEPACPSPSEASNQPPHSGHSTARPAHAAEQLQHSMDQLQRWLWDAHMHTRAAVGGLPQPAQQQSPSTHSPLPARCLFAVDSELPGEMRLVGRQLLAGGLHAFHHMLAAVPGRPWAEFVPSYEQRVFGMPGWPAPLLLLERYGSLMRPEELAEVASGVCASVAQRGIRSAQDASSVHLCLLRCLHLASACCGHAAEPAGSHAAAAAEPRQAAGAASSHPHDEPAAQYLALVAAMVLQCVVDTERQSPGTSWMAQAMAGPLLQRAVAGCRQALGVLPGGLTLPQALLEDVDWVCHQQDDPQLLVDAVVLFALCAPAPDARHAAPPAPPPAYTTCAQLIAVLNAHLDWFSDAQLVDVLRALGRLDPAPAPPAAALEAWQVLREQALSGQGGGSPITRAAQAPEQPAAGATPRGGGWQDMLAVKRGVGSRDLRLPDDMQDYIDRRYPSQGPAVDEDPALDLLARMGVRISRSMLRQPASL